MPSSSTLYNAQGVPIYQFGTAHRNTIRWAPHGRFLCIAGFGNLAGEMDFYDVVYMKKLGSNTAHCSVQSMWSPDSRFFLTATVAPRMNVDNGFKIFTYRGVGPVGNIDSDRAFFAGWRHALPSCYPDRPPSPKSKTAAAASAAGLPLAPAAAAIGKGGAVVVAPPVVPTAAYRPPGSRGVAASFTVKDTSTTTVGKVKVGGVNSAVTGGGGGGGNGKAAAYKPPTARARVIPGMAAAAAPAPAVTTAPVVMPPKKATPVAAAAAPAVAVPVVAPLVTAEEHQKETDKKIKALRKKLVLIQELQSKRASGVVLDADQCKKLDTLASVELELKVLQQQGSNH
jgi:translation initiation factor 2A